MTDFFYAKEGAWFGEGVRLEDVAAQYGTPCFVYSRAALIDAMATMQRAFSARPTLVCYAVKANPNLAILNLFASMGAGFDIVSGGELQRVIAAGGDPAKTVFSGVGKSEAEIRFALERDILCFNVESESELHRIDRIATDMGRRARISLRVNPDVDAKTHPYISTGLKNNKFGIRYDEAEMLYVRAHQLPRLEIVGIDCHIGSQILEVQPFVDTLDKILALVDLLARRGIALQHIDLGGGLGIRYRDESPLPLDAYADAIMSRLQNRTETLLLEPGRWLVGNAGMLLTRVEYLKHNEVKNFAVVDAAMNDLLRPALYDSYHDIHILKSAKAETKRYDIVGPVCESGDFLALDRELALSENALLSIASSGAYGMSMSSNYNTRARAAEVVVDGNHTHLIRARESIGSLFALEKILPDSSPSLS